MSMMTELQAKARSPTARLRVGPGKSRKVTTKVNMMTQGQGLIVFSVQSRVLKQFWFSILSYSATKFAGTGQFGQLFSLSSASVSSCRTWFSVLSCGQLSDQSWWTKNLSTLRLYSFDLQKAMFMKMLQTWNRMAMTKQSMMGTLLLLSGPKAATTINLKKVMSRPERAVPTVYQETTFQEKQLIWAKKLSWVRLPPMPARKAQTRRREYPARVCDMAREMRRMRARERQVRMLPMVMRRMQVAWLLMQWQLQPMSRQATKRGMEMKEQMLQSSKESCRKSRAASTTFHPSRLAMPFMVNTTMLRFLSCSGWAIIYVSIQGRIAFNCTSQPNSIYYQDVCPTAHHPRTQQSRQVCPGRQRPRGGSTSGVRGQHQNNDCCLAASSLCLHRCRNVQSPGGWLQHCPQSSARRGIN